MLPSLSGRTMPIVCDIIAFVPSQGKRDPSVSPVIIDLEAKVNS